MTALRPNARSLHLLLVTALGLSAAHARAAPDGAKAAEREALKRAILEVIQRSPLKSARISVQIRSLDDGAIIYAQNPDELLNPASNVKLVTSAAALVRLGPDYRFETEFLTDAPLQDGKARTLFVRGKGDPTVTTERLYGMVSELIHAGLKEVSGDLVIDDSYFDAERLAPGYDQENSDRAYMAPTGAVSLNWNSVGIYLRPGSAVGRKGAVEVEPASDYFVIENGLSTGRRHRRFWVSSHPDGQRQKITARGVVPLDRGTWSVWKKIDHPPLYFGHTLKALLQQRGVKVKGKVRLGATPASAKALHAAQSETLDLVLKKLNKHSSNFIAEQLIKTLGAEVKGAPGSFVRGIEVVEDFLEKEVGLPRGTYVMKNGSGLNDTNRFSAAQLDRVMRYMYRSFPYSAEYLSSLGIAATDGTLRYRFEGSDAVGRLRAKTGTLENVSALSGFVEAVGGEKFVFAVLVNDFPGRAGTVVQHIDALGAAVAATGSAKGPHSAASAMVSPETKPGPIEEIKTRVRTYLAIARQGDRRNIPFLRTAWRSEKDPAVRAVVAESLYQSDPQDYLGARMLLDSFSAAPEVYGRLRQVAKELDVEVPGVGSVLDLAAGGNLDALARLLELSRAAGEDRQAQAELADALSEVGRTAPDELILSLREAPSSDRDRAIELLAQGLVAAEDPQHAFWPALRRSMGSVDADLAAFSRQLETTLSLAIAQKKAPPMLATQPAPPSAAPPPRPEKPGG